MEVIASFSGRYKFLSNFYSVSVMYDGILYPSSEHAFQAAKTLNFEERAQIRSAPTPSEAKKQGQLVTLRQDWEKAKVGIMHHIVLDKFVRHPGLKASLRQTGDAKLVEGNWWGDTYWGVCNGKGTNHLGKILMEVRLELR